jgi:A/G-specific adenine glycosylase
VGKNPNRRSAHYARQSAFENSDRQIRGLILRTLLEREALAVAELLQSIGKNAERVEPLIARLIDEGFLTRAGDVLALDGHESER